MERKRSKTKTHVHGWDESEKQVRAALSQCEDVNTSDDSTTDRVQCAQCCMVVHFVVHIALNEGENVLGVVHNVP